MGFWIEVGVEKGCFKFKGVGLMVLFLISLILDDDVYELFFIN